MGREKALSWCLVLFAHAAMHEMSCGAKNYEEACAPSRCGIIANISHPFRLRDDPAKCGDRRYELACENNVTVLYLYSGKYYVQAINYNNFTIRLVDPGIREDDCSSLPRYFLSQSNFSDTFYFSNDSDPFSATQLYFGETIFKYIIYLNCSDPVRDASEYIDTAPCINWHSKGHIYAIVGDLLAANLKVQCHVKLFAAITSAWGSFLHNKHSTYADIHRLLTYGFEVSWWRRACADYRACPDSTRCFFNNDTKKLECKSKSGFCYPPMGIGEKIVCGPIMSKLKLFAEDHLYVVFVGLFKIIGEESDSGYKFYLTRLGVVTGICIVPYITAKFLFGIPFLFALLIYKWRRRHLSMYENIENFLQANNLMPIRYSYKEIKKMTRGFRDKLGEGGFGFVYKGKLRSGPYAAIKMLDKSKGNGQDFINEVATIGRIHHVHVVRLIGFCVEGSKRALLYEFMPNGSLEKYIFSKEESAPLSYDKIYEISMGVARGIAYLHHGCDMQILHFDIKPHNILLDENFIPKVSDFGLAKLYPVDDSIVTLTAARGTLGYMAPELFYKNIGGVSYKADVYSFGMLLMEMASRRKNLNPHAEHSSQLYFPLWIYDQFTEEKDIETKDLTEEEKALAKKMFIVALWCIQLKPGDRPSMNKVVEMLESQVESLEMPPKPELYPHETIAKDRKFNSEQTTSSDTIYSPNHLGKTANDVIPENNASNGER